MFVVSWTLPKKRSRWSVVTSLSSWLEGAKSVRVETFWNLTYWSRSGAPDRRLVQGQRLQGLLRLGVVKSHRRPVQKEAYLVGR